MSDLALKVESLYKQYRLGVIGADTLKEDIKLTLAKLRGKSLSDIYNIDSNDRMVGDSEYVWALQNINFEVKKGEILGIIGKNGAGKSTLLKILSKVTGPTKGSIKVNGRIASLLEVGTGMHPELTGRENIFLNGAILGMTKKEIKTKLDEIVEFSGIGKYLDTPVKRYSSGMKVRLGFAVAAHLDPEILIVDEVLAVGDAEFQKRCIGKMNDVSKNEGRTVLFVSHNMASIIELCDRALLMQDGKVHSTGNVSEIIPLYLSAFKAEEITSDLSKIKTRAGKSTKLSELLDEARDRALKTFEQRMNAKT
jgi:lipopolysaccharide transport system ATP-binding protein